ncbi:MAG: hypothetical protein CMP51_04925 [Flavobacteriales bacterium]|nr:hypothetical protein [Flavobacteriales bacterium]|tara:strand:- start:1968 stop:2699 length:732 start_codon:yes stop_codon:yes gene_type:complete
MSRTFYDTVPFLYGYTSHQDVIKNMHPALQNLIIQSSNKTIVDIGCGGGRNLVYSALNSDKVIGVDLSTKSLEFARNFISNDKVTLIQGNNLKIPLKSEVANLVISDGVIHHTGDPSTAFKECIRILSANGFMYLAVYKKKRYYRLLYLYIGGLFRFINNYYIGHLLIEYLYVYIHFFLYKIFKKNTFSLKETRSIFYDYFITPIASFHTKDEINNWIIDSQCDLIKYYATSGNCHVFVIKKK